MRDIRAFGDGALLVQEGSLSDVRALYAELTAHPIPGVREVVPAARTVLVVLDDAACMPDVRARLHAVKVESESSAALDGPLVVIPTRYDGPDLTGVAQNLGTSTTEVIVRHTNPEYVVAFCGFAPGFGYLVGGDPALRLPRRSMPRTRVAAGSVAIADEFSAVYPSSSPGGWNLLGSTEVRVWDTGRPEPALLAPGTRVRFEAVR